MASTKLISRVRTFTDSVCQTHARGRDLCWILTPPSVIPKTIPLAPAAIASRTILNASLTDPALGAASNRDSSVGALPASRVIDLENACSGLKSNPGRERN